MEGFPLHKIYNIGNNDPIELETFISCIENSLEKRAVKKYLPMQDGDVVRTYADISELEKLTNFRPATELQVGVSRFINWYKKYNDNI